MARNRLASLVVSLQSDIAQFKKGMEDASNITRKETQKISGYFDVVKKDTAKLGQSIAGLQGSFKGLERGLIGALGVASAGQAVKLADQFNVLNQRIKTATASTGDYKKVSEELIKISQRNGVALADTVSLFQSVSRGARELGASNTDIIKFSNTLQQLGTIGGSSAEQMSRALLQLSQSMSAGIFRAEEYNSIVENMPELMSRIAAGMGKTDGQIRQMVLSGKLLSKDVFKTILDQSQGINQEFQSMPVSLEKATVAMQNSLGIFVSKLDQTLGVTRAMVSALQGLSKEADGFGNIIAGIPSTKIKIGPTKEASLGNAWDATTKLIWEKLQEPIKEYEDRQAVREGRMTKREMEARIANREFARTNLFKGNLFGENDAPETAAAAKPKLLPTGAAVDQKALDKAKKKHETELKHSEQILANMRSQNEQLRAKLAQDDQAITKEKALLQLSKDKTLTDKEKKKYAEEINKLAAEHANLIKQQKIGEEKEKLAGILSNLKEKSLELKNQLSGQKEMNVLLQAEKDIQENVKIGKKETAEEQEKILAAAREVVSLEEKLKRQKIDKEIREEDQRFAERIEKEKNDLDSIGKSLREQNEILRLKLAGQEDLAKSVEMEREYQRDLVELKQREAEAIRDVQNNENYTDGDKAGQIEKIKNGYKGVYEAAAKKYELAKVESAENIKLNKSLEDQDKLLDQITTSTGTYKQKLADLNKAYSAGQITQKQWEKTAESLWKTQSKANSTLGDSVKQIGNNMTQAILNGQKLTNVFKDMGKALAALAAQKLIFEPLARGIDGLADRLFGTGRYTPRPTLPGSLAGGGGGASQLASAGSFPGFGALMGGAAGAGGMFGAGGLMNRTGGMFRNMFSSGNGLNATDPDILLSAYDRLWSSGNHRDALGNRLEDFEFYTNNISREEAAKRLGVLGTNPFRPPGGGYDFFGGIARSLGLPSFALGGTARAGQTALFGEYGPELGVPKQDMYIFTAPETRQILGPSASAQAWKNNLSWSSGMTTGDWMAKNERAWQLSQERNYLNSSLAPALNQLWRDDTIRKAQSMTAEMMRSGRTDHIGFDILNRVQNGGSMMMAMSPNFQLPTGDQQYSILKSMGASNALLQMAMDNDWLFQGGSSGMYASGSLGGFLNNPLGYKSMGIEGKTPWKTYQDIDAVDNIAYGGDGSQAAVALQQEQMKQLRWQQDAISKYNQSMMNRNPLGGYRGASQEYLNNIKSWGRFSNNHKPYADAYGFGVWSGSSTDGMSISNGGWVDSRGGGSSNDWVEDPYDSGDPNPQRFDPTVPSAEYQPKPGTAGDFLKQLNKNPYFDFASKTMGGLKEAFKSLLGASQSKNPSLSRLRDLPGRSLIGDLKESMRSYMPMGKTMGMDIPRSLSNPFPAYPAMMGMASAPKIYGVPTVRNVTNSSGGFGGTLSPGWLDNDTTYSPLFNPRYQAPRASSSFDRWATDPITAGRIHAGISRRAHGGRTTAGETIIAGDRGPELIMTRQPSYVHTASETAKMLGKPELKVIVNNTVSDRAEVVLEQQNDGSLALKIIEAVAKKAQADAAPRRRGR